jgi:hypothetical protein
MTGDAEWLRALYDSLGMEDYPVTEPGRMYSHLLDTDEACERLRPQISVAMLTTIDGQLISVGGVGDDAALQVQDIDGRILSGFTAKRHLAKELDQLLWEPVRLMGVGLWERDSEGVWSLSRMQVQGYERLEDEDASLSLARLIAYALWISFGVGFAMVLADWLLRGG